MLLERIGVLLFACAMPGFAAGPPDPAVSVAPSITALNFDALLDQLPAAAEEFSFDATTKSWSEHAVSKEMRRRLLAGNLTDEQIAAAIIRSKAIGTHVRWPRDRELAITLRAPLWLGMMGTITVRPLLPASSKAATHVLYGGCGLANDAERQRTAYMRVGTLSPSAKRVTFDVQLEARGLAWPEGGSRAWKGEVSLPMTVVESLAEAMSPVEDARFDAAVLAGTSILIAKSQATPPQTAMWINISMVDPLLAFVEQSACRGTVEILHDGRVVHTQAVDYRSSWRPPARASYHVEGLPASLLTDAGFIEQATVRIRGSRDASFEDLRRDSYWAGSLEVPLKQLLEKER